MSSLTAFAQVNELEPDEAAASEEINFRFAPDSCSYLPLYEAIDKWIGTRYKYAGGTANGIDCSGLVKHLYRDVYGKNLNGGSASLYSVVTRVPKENLQEGDMVFFITRKNRISHVGIYLHSGYFVHSSRSQGVIISHLEHPYYARRFKGCGRIVN